MSTLRPALVPGATICGRQRYVCDERGVCREHRGIDLCAPRGTPILCPFPGLVERARFSASPGNTMVVRHSPELVSVYLHLDRMVARQGSYVLPNQVIATVGNTGTRYDGRPMGYHLHFEVDRYWPAARADASARYDAELFLRSAGIVEHRGRLYWRGGFPAKRMNPWGAVGLLSAPVIASLAVG